MADRTCSVCTHVTNDETGSCMFCRTPFASEEQPQGETNQLDLEEAAEPAVPVANKRRGKV